MEKKSKKEIHQIATSQEKAVEKKPNDFESTDADRITCKGTHYLWEPKGRSHATPGSR